MKRIFTAVLFLFSLAGINSLYGATTYQAFLEECTTQIEKHYDKSVKRLTVTVFQTSQEKYRQKPEIGEYLADKLADRLVKSKTLKIYERSKLQDIMKEHQLLMSGVINEDEVVRLGELAPIDAILFASYLKLKDVVEINIRLVDVTSGEIEWTFSQSVPLDESLASLFASTQEVKQITEEERIQIIQDKLANITSQDDVDLIVKQAVKIPVFSVKGDIHKDIITTFNKQEITSESLSAFYRTNLTQIEKIGTEEIMVKCLMMLHFQRKNKALTKEDTELGLRILRIWNSPQYSSSLVDYFLVQLDPKTPEATLKKDVDNFYNMYKKGELGKMRLDDIFMPVVQVYFNRANYNPVTNDNVAIYAMELLYPGLSQKRKNTIGNSLTFLYRSTKDDKLKARIMLVLCQNFNDRENSLGIMYDFVDLAQKLKKAQDNPKDNPEFRGQDLPVLVSHCKDKIKIAYKEVDPRNQSTKLEWKNTLENLGIKVE